MTCIVGLVHKDGVTIGGDTAGVGGWSISSRKDTKVFRNGDYLIGFTSSFRMGQLLQYAFTPPEHLSNKDIMAFLVTTFVDAVRECLKTGGLATKQSEQEVGGTFLLAYRHRLFRIDNDYQVRETNNGYDACGCGEDAALGSMHTSDHMNQIAAPDQRIRWALEAAEACNNGVRGPFVIETLAHS